MLKTLDIENIAVIEKASVDFSGGLNVLTGETGAGKSIVVDSINAIMGERTSRELVRYGADNAYVSAYFDDICDSALNKLKKFDIELEEDNSLLITRKISANGKSLCKVNGKTVTVSMLKEICSYLVNVHGQHDSQALLNPDLQYNYIDMLLEDKSVLSDYKETFKKLISVRRKLKSFAKDEDNKESLLELLNFQIEELEKADIKVMRVQNDDPITSIDMFELGLSGTPNAKQNKKKLLKSLDLPEFLSTSSLISYLNSIMNKNEFYKYCNSLFTDF